MYSLNESIKITKLAKEIGISSILKNKELSILEACMDFILSLEDNEDKISKLNKLCCMLSGEEKDYTSDVFLIGEVIANFFYGSVERIQKIVKK